MNKAFRDLMENAKEQRQKSLLNLPIDDLASAMVKPYESAAAAADLPINVPRKIQVGNLIFDYLEKKATSTAQQDVAIGVVKKGRRVLSIEDKQSITRLIVSVPDWVAKAIDKIEGPGGKGKKLKKLIAHYHGYQEREKKQLAPLKKILDSVIKEREEYVKASHNGDLYQSKHYRIMDKLVSQAQVALDLGHLLCVEDKAINHVLGKKYLDEYQFCLYLLANINHSAASINRPNTSEIIQ